MIGSLLYLTASRPDIMFATCLCARFQSNPKESHLSAVKRIFRYLNGSTSTGLWYPHISNFTIVGYSDADYAGCKLDRKSTSGRCQLLGKCLVSWSSKMQSVVALSTTEAEYMALGNCCTQVLWMKQILSDYSMKISCVPIFCDNSSAINITRNPILHSRTKHIEIKHHFIRDQVHVGNVSVEFVSTDMQLADIFTKPLDATRFSSLKNLLGIIDKNDKLGP